MKQIIFLLLFVSILPAKYLPKVSSSFGQKEQKQLLQHFNATTKISTHKSNNYMIKKGWNQFFTPKNGIDVIKTFEDISTIKFVLTYDRVSKLWAGFTLKQSVLKDIKEMLLLKYLEPNVTFYILSDRDIMIKIKYNTLNNICKKIVNDKRYDFIEDSGIDNKPTYSHDGSIGVMPRYHSQFDRGIYDDTRITLIYPKIKTDKNANKKYGPADPFILLKYAKEYENKAFYIYDYLQKKCSRGVFPSKKTPPVPLLQELKI